MLSLISDFLIGGFLGYAIEDAFRLFSGRDNQKILHDNHFVPFLPIYGFGAMATQLPVWTYPPLIFALEEIGFRIGKDLTGEALWDYDDKFIPIGHSSVLSILCFTFLISAGKIFMPKK
jgi:uncharacterized membrane protein